MRKLIFSAMAIMVIASSVAFAQKTRSVGVYFDANSGNLNQSDGVAKTSGNTINMTTPQKLFAGNEFEFGAYYRQNFESAQWLTFQFKALVVATQSGVYEADKTTGFGTPTITTKPGKYIGMGTFGINIPNFDNLSGFGAQTPRAQAGLMLNSSPLGFDGLAVNLFFDTRTLGVFELFYTIGLGNAGGLTVGALVEFWANPITASHEYTTTTGEDKIAYAKQILDVFAIRVAYSVPFAEIWGFTSQVDLRFQGPSSTTTYDNGTAINPSYNNIKMWDDNFASGFQVRWDNTLSVNVGGLGLWANVRYDLNNALSDKMEARNYKHSANGDKTGFFVDYGIQHVVNLRAGLSYSFDLSGL